MTLAILPILLAAFTVRELPSAPEYIATDHNVAPLHAIDSASWVWGQDGSDWMRFRNEFEADGSPFAFEVSADERYILLLDGQVIARGPVRGFVDHWYCHSYAVDGLSRGKHMLEAVVWRMGQKGPLAQFSYSGGFILKARGAYDKALSTGSGPWQAAPLKNTSMTDAGTSGTFGVGTGCRVKGTAAVNEHPDASLWRKVVVVREPVKASPYGIKTYGWTLFPADRPEMSYILRAPGRFKAAIENDDRIVYRDEDTKSPRLKDFNSLRNITIPPRTRLRLAWDLGNYYCAYPELRVSRGRGAKVRWGWTESLTTKDQNGKMIKGNRDEFIGKGFHQKLSDVFECDGREGAFFTSPWWRCGRWCEFEVETADEPLTIDSLQIAETGYPLSADAAFECDDEDLMRIGVMSERTLRCCVHDMTFDCPYYEQQMYPGDTRIQLEILRTFTRDTRMPRFCMSIFDFDRRANGMVAMNFPTRMTQESSTYTMCWLMMFKDYLDWTGDLAFLKLRLPGAHAALGGLAIYENADGLLENLPGWPFMDWVVGDLSIDTGVAPDGKKGVSALNNLQYLLALQSVAAVDRALGEKELAAYCERRIATVSAAIKAKFMSARGILADDLKHEHFSEHAQCMAILAGILNDEERQRALKVLESKDALSPASTYFAYYLFRAFAKCGRVDLIRKNMTYWKKFLAVGAKTAFENQNVEFRSDCHAWSACPIYFYHTAFAGVRPSEYGFRKVRIAPQPAGLRRIKAATPCPQGKILTDLTFEGNSVRGTITLPEGVSGVFEYAGRTQKLIPGSNGL